MPHRQTTIDVLHDNDTSQTPPALPPPSRRVAITAYRLIFTVTVISLGGWKAAASAKGQAITSNALDAVIGIALAVMCVALCAA